MIFGLFGSKKKQTVADLLAEFVAYQQLVGHISKAKSLLKLKRAEEANKVFSDAEGMIQGYLKSNPREKKGLMMLALLYSEAGDPAHAEPIIERLLHSGDFQLDNDERLVLSAELQKLQRQKPAEQRSPDSPSGFTQIYCCAKCGRLHNFVSMPCPHCDWSPQTIDELARSMILSNNHFNIPALLLLAREIGNGRPATDVVQNLMNDGRTYLSTPKQREGVELVFSMLRQNEHKNHRSIEMVRECPHCRHRVLLSGAEQCDQCNQSIAWPDAVRTLVCIDNLLWLFEQRVEASSAEAFSDFVCVLVAMANNLLRKQEAPSARDRQYSLRLLADMEAVSDMNKGAVVQTSSPKDLKIYLVKDSMRDDSETFGIFLFQEIGFFVTKMEQGVAL